MSSNEPRDQLAAIVREHFPEYITGTCLCGIDAPDLSCWSTHLATLITADGWRPPPRVIETPDELDALPVGSIVMEIDQKDWQSNPCPIVWMRVDIEGAGLRWEGMGDGGDWPTAELDVPAMLLWEPVIV